MEGNKLIKRCVTLGIINVLVLIASIFCIVNSIGSYWNQSMNLGMMIVAIVLDVLMLVAFGIFDYVLIEDYVKEYKDGAKENDSGDIMIEEVVEVIGDVANAASVASGELTAMAEAMANVVAGDTTLVESESKDTIKVKSTEEAPMKKKRGRPRKKPVDEVKE